MTEVQLPVKFLFVLMGQAMEECVEIGRSLSTLFSTLVKTISLSMGMIRVRLGFSRNCVSSNGSS